MLRDYRHRRRRGFTLTEIAIVLGIVGLVLGAIWIAGGQASSNQKTEKAVAQMMQIIAGYRSFYAQHGIDTAGQVDVTCIGVDAGFFPAEMVPAATASACAAAPTSAPATYPQGPWLGSTVLVTTIQSNNALSPQYNNLSQTACNAFANSLYASSEMTYQAIYNGSSWSSQWLPPYGTGTPWTPAQISSYCGAGNNNTVQIGVNAR